MLDTVTSYFVSLMQMKSPALYEHAKRVASYSAATAVYMRLSSNEVTLIRYAGFLHDIGLLCMPNKLLAKHPYLSRRELSLYKKHPDLAANMLEAVPGMEELIPYIRFHHERWDGTGYPKHLKNVNIPLGARIVAVANYYDSVIYASPDFKTRASDAVIKDIFSVSGSLFDPDVINAFIKVLLHSRDISVKK
ncbi:MAG: HD domain-containing phosphohydrolase [Dialister sp.]|nr:HD domain-containing phosphohydrolase [Dialister sp.]